MVFSTCNRGIRHEIKVDLKEYHSAYKMKRMNKHIASDNEDNQSDSYNRKCMGRKISPEAHLTLWSFLF
jgi:hypothetical protein